jgi:hypothetical protein
MDIEVRLVKMETVTEYHNREIDALRKSGMDLKTGIDKIENTLTQIRWLLIGGAIVFLGQSTGILPAVGKLLLGS